MCGECSNASKSSIDLFLNFFPVPRHSTVRAACQASCPRLVQRPLACWSQRRHACASFCMAFHSIVGHDALIVARGRRQVLTWSCRLDRSASSVSLTPQFSPDSFVLSPDHRESEQGRGEVCVEAGGCSWGGVPGFPEHEVPKDRGGESLPRHATSCANREPGGAESQGARGQLACVVTCGDMPSVVTWWPSASRNRQRRSTTTVAQEAARCSKETPQSVLTQSLLKQPSVVTWWSAQVGSLIQKPPAPPRRPQSLKFKPPAPPGKPDKPPPPPRR